MKTIKQTEEIQFHALNFKEAIILFPLMEALVNTINKNRVASLWRSLSIKEKEQYRKAYDENTIFLTAEQMEKIVKVLTDLGFESFTDLKTPTLEDLEKK